MRHVFVDQPTFEHLAIANGQARDDNGCFLLDDTTRYQATADGKTYSGFAIGEYASTIFWTEGEIYRPTWLPEEQRGGALEAALHVNEYDLSRVVDAPGFRDAGDPEC